MSASYTVLLDRAIGAFLHVEFTTNRRDVVDYAVVLLVEVAGQMKAVRLYDGAHGRNELHRYSRRGAKRTAETFHSGTLGQGMRAAIEAIQSGYSAMVESWQRR